LEIEVDVSHAVIVRLMLGRVKSQFTVFVREGESLVPLSDCIAW